MTLPTQIQTFGDPFALCTLTTPNLWTKKFSDVQLSIAEAVCRPNLHKYHSAWLKADYTINKENVNWWGNGHSEYQKLIGRLFGDFLYLQDHCSENPSTRHLSLPIQNSKRKFALINTTDLYHYLYGSKSTKLEESRFQQEASHDRRTPCIYITCPGKLIMQYQVSEYSLAEGKYQLTNWEHFLRWTLYLRRQ